MTLFRLERLAPRLSVDQAWQRLTDWPLHADVVPLTRITVLTEPPSHEGTAFVGRTGVGPLGFDDPMEVTAWEPPPEHTPARCRLEKHGRLLRGWAEFRVHPHPPGGARVVWEEDLRVRAVPRLMDPAVRAGARRAYGYAVDRLLTV
ncbi:SRPBCC family protein [Streptomyces griseoaurantiacus]|uniref:SRPBCC family protein n=1 Tax=Streptomyces griseoaurantiacus TaxID=68213 RepID=A0A7W2HT17_9ACTN|nr:MULTISPECIES: SRPBCC family protein [Streptomyces]MBA5220616.1 SRPBCC family protein [Streptomyces griseoaurantiacus]MCF0086926.1 hypothetical protein [Streptomyces sp. MH192]MCF0103232.1 hypothetical protein [Streptomyces sp. MH191]